LKIRVFYENVSFRIKNWKKIRNLIGKVIADEGKFSGDLNFILTDDETVRTINIKYLKHNWYTDVISFNYNEPEGVNGEIYISIDTVRRNAKEFKVKTDNEMLRVIIHGVLHLCGYEDGTVEKKEQMHSREDYWIMRI
jgi:probable rRNA maturation factor